MAQITSILPQCIQPAATQGITAVNCQSLACACKSSEFLYLLEQAILTSCDTTNQALAFSSARNYCTKVDPGLKSYRGAAIIATTVIFTLLAILAVILRFWARKLGEARFGWDDWLVAAALLCALGYDGLAPAGLRTGEGQHQFMVNPQVGDTDQHNQYSSLWLITASNVLVRLSIFALYLRIFSALPRFRKVLLASSAFVVIANLIMVLVYSFSCQPIAYLLDKKIPGGHCWNQSKIFAASCAVDTATGIWALILPLPIIGRLQTTVRRRLVLIALFSIGAFTCVTAVLRIPLLQLDIFDYLWTIVPFAVWSLIETNMCIVSVCLPTMAPLFQTVLPRYFSAGRSKQSHIGLQEDEARIYTGGSRSTRGNQTRVTATRLEEGVKHTDDVEDVGVWSMGAIGVKKEVNADSNGSLSSHQGVYRT